LTAGPDSFSEVAYDAVVIGGGFYGATIAAFLRRAKGLPRVLLVERDGTLLGRASYRNQARVHNGYHYPRSFTTAYRSRVNFPRFLRDWPSCVKSGFTMIYAIAGQNSRVSSLQFERFCRAIGAPLEPASAEVLALFERRRVAAAYQVQECAFDASLLAEAAAAELAKAAVEVRCDTAATAVTSLPGGSLAVDLAPTEAPPRRCRARYVFNCTYSALNQLRGDFPGTTLQLKHEIAELALVEPPKALQGLGVTVMDGPFFSVMPFPSRGLHTFSHVRYTPHLSLPDRPGADPELELAAYDKASRFDRMIRDASRYLPALLDSRYVDSLFEVKSVLQKNETDDGRPILFERHRALPNCFSVLGAKIDNIFDVLTRLDEEPLAAS
jgi:glycine/D-amino acid oxidase-like deaminating enzyme